MPLITADMTGYSGADQRALEERVLILAPSRRDAPTVAEILEHAGFFPEVCADLAALCHAFEHGGAGTALIAQEALRRNQRRLSECLDRQPPWSDLPILLVASPG